MPIAGLLISHPVLTVIAAVFLIFILRSVRIANQYERAVVFQRPGGGVGSASLPHEGVQR